MKFCKVFKQVKQAFKKFVNENLRLIISKSLALRMFVMVIFRDPVLNMDVSGAGRAKCRTTHHLKTHQPNLGLCNDHRGVQHRSNPNMTSEWTRTALFRPF